MNRLGIYIDPATIELFDPTKKPPIDNDKSIKPELIYYEDKLTIERIKNRVL